MTIRPFDQILSVDDLITTSERLGGHFFDDDTLKFFNSRILSDLYWVDNSRGYFVTSERFDYDTPRTYSVRYYVVTHNDEKNSDSIDIGSVDEGYQLATAYRAKKMAKELADSRKNS